MGTDPAVLWYPDDWLGGTMHLSRLARACYFDLLMMQFHRESMSTDEINECLGNEIRVWPVIRDKFVKTDDGRYYNARMRYEIERRRKYVDSRRSNAKQRQTALQIELPLHMDEHMHEDMQKHVPSHMEKHMGNGNGNRIRKGKVLNAPDLPQNDSESIGGFRFQSAGDVAKWLGEMAQKSAIN